MASRGASFWRVIRSYSIEEKIVSMVLVVVVVALLIASVVDIFKRPEFFAGASGFYTEGLINDRPTMINSVYADLAEANRDISSLVFSGLTRYDPEVQAFVKDLADVAIDEEGTTYTFTLRDDVTWHDDEPLTAEDVYYTFHDVIQHPEFQNPVLKANFDGVEIAKVDDRTITFKLTKPNSFFITNLNVGILPEHILGGVPVAELPQSSFNLQPIGTGPYKVDSALELMNDGRQRVLLTLNDEYYREKPQIQNIRFHIYPDADSMKKEVGTLNIIAKAPRTVQEQIQDDARFDFLHYELPQYTAVFMNMNSAILQKDKVRIALQKAINKDDLLALFDDKMGVDTPIMALVEDQEEWLYQPNIEEAQGALFDSGYKMDEESPDDPYRKDSDGENLKLTMLVPMLNNPVAAEDMQKTVDFLVEAWKAVGVEVEAQFEPVDIFGQRIQSRDYDLLITGESLGYNLDTFSYWHSSQIGEAGLNLSNYGSFAVDALIEKVRDTFDKEEKAELIEQMAEEIATDVPAIFLYRPSYTFVTDNKVQGISLENWAYPSDRFADIAQWCIACE